MSRIHDALKKAEEERQLSGLADVHETVVAPIDHQALADSYMAPAMPPVAPQFSEEQRPMPETLLSRCVKADWNPDNRTMLFMNGRGPSEIGMEEFRTLRARLYQARAKRPLKTVMVASALPGEGKSFVSANLAQVLARQQGRRVLLIDGDVRRSRLHIMFGAPSTPGLTDYLAGDADESSIVQRSHSDNLFFIPGGRPVSNPAELIANGRFRTLLDRLGPLFSWVVIDSPPAVPVSDASRMSELCDGILLVVHAGSTPYPEAQKARSEFKDKPLLGVVLNRSKEALAYASKYYGHYGQGTAKG